MSMKRSCLVLFCLACGALLYPEEQIVCPKWSVSVVGESGDPVAGITVRRSCQDYSVENTAHQDDATTGAEGRVTFGEIRIRTPRLLKWVGNVTNFVTLDVHASYGLHAYVFAFGKGLEGSPVSTPVSKGFVEFWTGSPERMESSIVVTARS